MTTLNNIAENIAFAYGEQFNDTLQQSIKDSIVEYRAMLIRQDLERNPLSYTDYLQSFCIELEEVDSSECPGITLGKTILKSKSTIPTPVRLKNAGRINFHYVGSIDRSTILTFETGQGLAYVSLLDFQDDIIYYTVRNNYLYVLNNLRLCKLVIEEIIADPREIDDCDYPDRFPDDVPFYFPKDMVAQVKKFIKSEYSKFITDGEEVNIDKDDRD